MTPTVADDTRDTRDGWLGAKAAGTYLDIHPEQVRQACRDGRLHFARLGGGLEYRFRRWWLDAYVEGRAAAEVAAEEERLRRASGRWTGTRRTRKRAPSEPDRAAS